jgi:hypothetical protein
MIYEVGKAATSATSLRLRDLTRYIFATSKATIRYIIVSVINAPKEGVFNFAALCRDAATAAIDTPGGGVFNRPD